MTATTPSAAPIPVAPVFTNTEWLALARLPGRPQRPGRVVHRRRLDRRHRPRRGTLPRAVSAVRFTPSARAAWHSHAVGQTLYVTEGKGLHQPRGGQIEEIRAGDIVYTPADQWHWHGAAPGHFMTHLSITEAVPATSGPKPTGASTSRTTNTTTADLGLVQNPGNKAT